MMLPLMMAFELVELPARCGCDNCLEWSLHLALAALPIIAFFFVMPATHTKTCCGAE